MAAPEQWNLKAAPLVLTEEQSQGSGDTKYNHTVIFIYMSIYFKKPINFFSRKS